MPRKTSLTPEIAEALIEVLKRGNYMTTAADFVGVTPQTVYNWLKRGDELKDHPDENLSETERMFVDFFEGVKNATAWAEVNALDTIRSASATNWQAAAWFLERKAPDRFGRVQRTEISGPGGEAIEINAVEVSRKIEAMLDKQEKAIGRDEANNRAVTDRLELMNVIEAVIVEGTIDGEDDVSDVSDEPVDMSVVDEPVDETDEDA